MSRVFAIATGQDTGGWNARLVEAFRRHGSRWYFRSMVATRNYLEYPEDLPYDRNRILGYYREADAVQLQQTLAGWERYDDGNGKPTILQHHGTVFREDHEAISAQARLIRAVEIATTLDLTLLEPGIEWVGVPYNRAELQAIRAQHYRPADRIRIAHAPTNRAIKGTDDFIAAFERLSARHDIELVLIEQRPWRDCLALKATADIYYDQMDLGYGCNAVEAWGMGIPVVAGVRDRHVRAYMVATWGRWPFAFAQPDTLEGVLERLIVSEAARQDAMGRGSEHFDRYHDEAKVTAQLEQVYDVAPETVPGPLNKARIAAERRERRQQRIAARRARVAA